MTFAEFTEFNESKSSMVTRNSLCLVSVVFSDEVVKIKFPLLPLDMYLSNGVSGDKYLPGSIKEKKYFLLPSLGI